MPPIAVENLEKSFGQQRVLQDLTLQIDEGTTLAVLGRSGTGKSVLLKLLIGLQRPDSGAVRILGREISGLAPRELSDIRKKMGFLFQQAALYDALTVAENVEFPLRRHTDLNHRDRRQKVEELLSSVGLDRDLEKMPSEISGGMQKRVGLARALALEPTILLFDEPTSGLDPITATEIGRLIADLKSKRKATSVVVTHDLRVARLFTDRFVLIHEGKLVAQGTYDDLRKSDNQVAQQFLKESE